ncbi:MAG: tRNA (5-methylaminomethyl-2-thiouridine)(34)-methyltransferase MnmD [Flavobacteriales bacterium]
MTRIVSPIRTGDGSLTLTWGNEHYHSVNGAVAESTHVFIKHGLEARGLTHADVLEVGLGTGLNLLLTWVRCLEGKLTADYTALEPFPLPASVLNELRHCDDLAWPGLHEPFMERMTATTAEWHEALGGLRFRRLAERVQDYDVREAHDVIYFDAFAPQHQPEMWTADVFARMHQALRPGGALVTYCAKGEVRRTMQSVSFSVERLQGPPGKREMLRATRS